MSNRFTRYIPTIPTSVPRTVRTTYVAGAGAGITFLIIVLLVIICSCSVSLLATNWERISDWYNTLGSTESYEDTSKY